MEITVKKVTDWQRVVDATRMTVDKGSLGKEPSNKFKFDILRAEHSPIRLLEFDITFKDVPHFVAMHLVRHNQGVEKFVATQREDRTGIDRNTRKQTDPVNFMLSCNAQALINISRKRLCRQADAETRKVWSEVVEKIAEIEPIVAHFCVPNCVYCGGRCPEIQCCGYVFTEHFAKQHAGYMSAEVLI